MIAVRGSVRPSTDAVRVCCLRGSPIFVLLHLLLEMLTVLSLPDHSFHSIVGSWGGLVNAQQDSKVCKMSCQMSDVSNVDILQPEESGPKFDGIFAMV